MDTTLDARGLACPLPAIKARRALAAVPPGAALIVLATDPEAPIDIAAVAADAGCAFTVEERDGVWRLTLRRARRTGPAPGVTPRPGPPRR
jgi:tRNA 2-thiouridine synthesizing protein A